MAGRTGTSIFISYARRDGGTIAARLRDDLSRRKFDVWLDTDRIEGAAEWSKKIEQALDRCDVVLALLTPASYISEICRAEQLRSLRKAKCVIPVLAQARSDIPLHLEAKHYRDLSGSRYAAGFARLLLDIRGGKGVRLKAAYRVTYVTAPPLPRNYVERPDALARLRNSLVTEGGGPSIALTALAGMGGIGKTVLAQALSHDEVTQLAFPDGVIWVTAGKEPRSDLVTRMQEVRRALGEEPGDMESELQCINRYRSTLRDKAALVIVDDVWRSADIEPFRAEAPRSRLLLTTRDASIAATVGAEEHVADLLTPAQARDVLARWSGTKGAELPAAADELIRECGRLPLAVAMIGAMLRGRPRAYWEYVHTLLRDADLAKIQAQFPAYPHADLLRAVQVSVDALDMVTRERYFALAVLLEDMPAHSVIQQTLWNADRLEALAAAEQLVSLSLAEREGEGGAIRLHDLQLDYVRAQYADRDALELIHGALRLSAHVLANSPAQFASQMVGRLMPHAARPGVLRFADSTIRAAPRPWLRPLQPALNPPGTGLLRTLTGHSDLVSDVALSADGRRVVSASYDGTLKVWDVDTGHEVWTLTGHAGKVERVAVSADGRSAISASRDHTLKVWDLETGSEWHTLAGHSSWVHSVALSANGRRAVSGSADMTLKVWDLEAARELRTLAGHSDAVMGVGISGDGRLAVSASADHTLKVWDLETGRELHALAGHSDSVSGVGMSADGRRAVSGSRDHTVRVWDLEQGCELRTLHTQFSAFWGPAMSADGRRAVSGSADTTLKVWDLETGREVRTLGGRSAHSGYVRGVAMSAEGRRAVCAPGDDTVKVWDLDSSRELRTPTGHADAVRGVRVSGDGRRAVSACADQTLKVWDLETGRELRTVTGHSGPVDGVAVSADGRWAVSAGVDKMLKVWDLETGRELRTLAGHSDMVMDVAISADGQRAVSASYDKTLKVWDLEAGRELRTLNGHADVVYRVSVSADGRLAVSGSWDKTLKVWDLETGHQLRTLADNPGLVLGVAVSADGRRVVFTPGDDTLKVWDLENNHELRTMAGHSGSVRDVGMSADERWAASASWDCTIKVWDLETGQLMGTFTCDDPADCCTFAGNRTIVAGDLAGKVHFLRLELLAVNSR